MSRVCAAVSPALYQTAGSLIRRYKLVRLSNLVGGAAHKSETAVNQG